MTIQRQLILRNILSYQLLRHLPLTPVYCVARLQCCLARLGWNHADWGRMVFRDESRFQLVLTIIEYMSGDPPEQRLLIQLSLLHTTHVLNKELGQRYHFI
ncbi:hypothetical protein TNCV_5020871 [Trichonephila clavipes]|nr:hypothetical protein TNCV_5020871 [Trichonephila clavipes]